MIYEVEIGREYLSKSGLKFRVKGLAKHGQACLVTMVIYENIGPTSDAKPGTTWVIEEKFFLERFKEV